MAYDYDAIVIGSGPAGQKAAVQLSKAGRSVLVVERDSVPGGECVQRGTIPSKTLRENAVYLSGLKRRSCGVLQFDLGDHTKIRSLMLRLEQVLEAHSRFIAQQFERNHIIFRRGRARLLGTHEVEVRHLDGTTEAHTAETIIIAAGSRPRMPADIDIDHEHIYDSDSILALSYLPQSLTVIGAGVIACEFATVFQALGVHVTIVDKGERPMPFLDPELSERMLHHFEQSGGVYLPVAEMESIEALPEGGTLTKILGRPAIKSDKALVALGRTASLAGLGLESAGLTPSERGHLPVNENLQTAAPNIYGVGDVIGPPALAATAMDQGRRAARHALGMPSSASGDILPMGIYTIPEIAGVGRSSADSGSGTIIGRANFDEIARGQINGDTEGVLKLVADANGRRILGAHIIGEGATELIHLAQVAMVGGLDVDNLVSTTFNFPTMAEAYRVAALDIISQRPAALEDAA